jgi:hypothetical protein
VFVFFDDTAGVEVGKRALGGHSLLSLILLSVDLREVATLVLFLVRLEERCRVLGNCIIVQRTNRSIEQIFLPTLFSQP